VGAALLTRNGADDLPTWAAILFGLAALLGLALIVNAWRVDRVATRKGTIRRAGRS
jgi:hypothetical protein